jgi:hypothetical protein
MKPSKIIIIVVVLVVIFLLKDKILALLGGNKLNSAQSATDQQFQNAVNKVLSTTEEKLEESETIADGKSGLSLIKSMYPTDKQLIRRYKETLNLVAWVLRHGEQWRADILNKAKYGAASPIGLAYKSAVWTEVRKNSEYPDNVNYNDWKRIEGMPLNLLKYDMEEIYNIHDTDFI